MHERIRSLVIVGGGTAGWIAAAYLSKALQRYVDITVIEAATIPKIGVGEATVPNLQRVLFDYLEIPEFEWMRQCNASLKTAVKFVNWARPPANGESDHFYHTFGLLPNCDNIPLSHYWFFRHSLGDPTSYHYACLKEPPLLDAKLSPVYLDGRRATKYAWHFDAHLVAEYLKNVAVQKLGVHHVVDEIEHVLLDDRGFIKSVQTKSRRTVEGELFVDCSGFRGLLINQALGEPFIDMRDHLLCDSAVAAPILHDDEKNGIEAYTSAIAMRSGWTWKIPMLGRFGSGYVFSSKFATMDEAARDFCALWNIKEDSIPLNKIRFRVGRNRRAWVANCVSIGLSSCFLEPLESTGIYFITASVFQLAKHFPDRSFDPKLIARFNREIEFMFDDSRDFIQAHYVISPREDTPFWRANKHDLHLSDNFKEKMEMYEAGLPVNVPTTSEESYYGNFEFEFRNFWTNHSYYCIFSGLGFNPTRVMPALLYKSESRQRVEPMFEEIARTQSYLVSTLPRMHEWLRCLHYDSTVLQTAERHKGVAAGS